MVLFDVLFYFCFSLISIYQLLLKIQYNTLSSVQINNIRNLYKKIIKKRQMNQQSIIIQDIDLLRSHKHIQYVQAKSLYQYQISYVPSTLSNAYSVYKWRLKLILSKQYPKIAPQLMFLDPIYHLNVAKNGDIYLAILKSDWSSVNNFNYIIDQLDNLLDFPDSNHPGNRQACSLYMSNQEEYFKKVQQCFDVNKISIKHKNSSNGQKSDCEKQLISGLNQMHLSKFSSFANNTIEGKGSLPLNMKLGQYNFSVLSPKQSCIQPTSMKFNSRNKQIISQKMVAKKNQKLKEQQSYDKNQIINHWNPSSQNQQQIGSPKVKTYQFQNKQVQKKTQNKHLKSQRLQIHQGEEFIEINVVKNSQIWAKNINKSFVMLKQQRVNISQTEQFSQLSSSKDNCLDKTFHLIEKLNQISKQEKLQLTQHGQKVKTQIESLLNSILKAQSHIKKYKNDPVCKILKNKLDAQVPLLQILFQLEHKIKLKSILLLTKEVHQHLDR